MDKRYKNNKYIRQKHIERRKRIRRNRLILIVMVFVISLILFMLIKGDDLVENKESLEIKDESGNVVELQKEEKKEEIEYKEVVEIVEPGYEQVESYLQEESENKRFQGVALVAKGDEIKFAKAYGYADLEPKRENLLTTRFAIASNTKQFTATAIMQLVEDGKLNLEDTIDKYFPKYEYGSIITVKNLLQMRSGIPDYLNEPEIYFKDEKSLQIINTYKNDKYDDKYVQDSRWSEELILESLYLTGLTSEPDTIFDYCNTNYYLLGLIIEQTTGQDYEEYIEENIFKPCKMVTSSMEEEELDAKGYGSVDSGEIVVNPEFTYAAGNIHANIFDLFRWNRMLHTGNIISEKSYNEMITPVEQYGYGLFIREDGIISHSGVIDGFNSNTEYNPATDTTIIVMENLDPTTDLLDAKYDTSIIRGLIN